MSRGLKLRAALILLYDDDGRFLLQHRSDDARVMPGCWGFFGGQIRHDESVEDALRRETREEISYELKAPVFLLEQDFRVDEHEGHMYAFVEKFEGDKSSLSLMEGQGWGWYRADEIAPLNMIEHDRFLVEKAQNLVAQMEGKQPL